MATFKFWNTANGGKWQKNDGTVHAPKGLQGDDEITVYGNVVTFNIGPYAQNIDLDTDTVEIDDVAFAGTAAELQDELNAVFPKANSGSGGSGLGSYILSAPDDSQWLLGVNDSGALVTEAVDNPVGASALTSLTLRSPDNTQWQVSVTNAGALTTTAV